MSTPAVQKAMQAKEAEKRRPGDQVDSYLMQWISVFHQNYEPGMTVQQLHDKVKPEVYNALATVFQQGQGVQRQFDEWKQKGNAAFKKAEFDLAVLCYNRALTEARTAEELAVLYNNRATCLFSMRMYSQALADSQVSIETNPAYMKGYYRRGMCLKALGHDDEGKHDVALSEGKADAHPPELAEKIAAVVQATLASAKRNTATPSPTFISDLVHVKEDAVKGRHLVARDYIPKGTVVIAEDAYAMALRQDQSFTHCEWCLQSTPCLYPSKHLKGLSISRGLYCSEECADLAFEHYGKVEVQHPFSMVCPLDALLAERMMLRRSMPLPLGKDSALPSSSPWQPPGGMFDDRYIETLQGFTKEVDPTMEVGGYETAVAAIAVISILPVLVKEFESRSADETLPLQHILPYADTFRQRMRQVTTNAITVSKLMERESKAGQGMQAIEHLKVAKGVFAVASLINHSCDPTAFINFGSSPADAGRRIQIRVVRNLVAGEEITISYGPTKNKIHSAATRRKGLREQYHFDCQCECCAKEVPELLSQEREELLVKAANYYQKARRMMHSGRHAD
eukprot:Sspe_Gene.489::Locus_167_Transcript_1_1_Confidence_1.000_Length_1702::g.489::m.489